MDKKTKKGSKAGLPPGTLVHVGEIKTEKARITIISYNKEGFIEKNVEDIEECQPFKDTPGVNWINIDGIHLVDIIYNTGKYFKLHPLLLEDIMNTEQRPKMEDFNDNIFIVIKMLSYNKDTDELLHEQVSLVLSSNIVISFQEREGDIFDPVRNRIRKGMGQIRRMGADYLAYALVDIIIDNYFVILEQLGEKIDILEEELVTNPTPDTMKIIHRLKRYLIFLRKSIWPLREVIGALERSGSRLIQKNTKLYLRDVYDHTIQVIDTIETFRDIVSGMLDIYLSSISNKMNEVMKVLTIIATIFIPLTFIAGIYGMNFKYMPELDWALGYPLVLMIMLGIGIVMGLYFKKKMWI